MLDTEEVNVWSELKGLISIPAKTEHCLYCPEAAADLLAGPRLFFVSFIRFVQMIEQGPWKLVSPAPLSMENRILDCKVFGS